MTEKKLSKEIEKILKELVGGQYDNYDEAIDELVALFSHALQEELRETEKAFGGCKKCYGKGYATYWYGISGSSDPDFKEEGFETKPETHMVFCICDRGKQLEDLGLGRR